MSTHNIGFYEDLIKIIFQLSLNFIQYAPFLFFFMIECMISELYMPSSRGEMMCQ